MDTDTKPQLNGDAGSPASSDPGKWWHHCRIAKDMVALEKGEACPGCARREGDPAL